jgi:hypothetical protein
MSIALVATHTATAALAKAAHRDDRQLVGNVLVNAVLQELILHTDCAVGDHYGADACSRRRVREALAVGRAPRMVRSSHVTHITNREAHKGRNEGRSS